ncbi:hypothetical protein BpHYR1_046668 [Brachionus plicatilis]|uniref:Uncharacterized protein n=1 Tax=Brachionus plicatilis TaxID=10195 RepID=A0A3M7RW28_BRAPC|nr:hypothetical protein BpHYR1_046668 [Brachionus plicatilis]
MVGEPKYDLANISKIVVPECLYQLWYVVEQGLRLRRHQIFARKLRTRLWPLEPLPNKLSVMMAGHLDQTSKLFNSIESFIMFCSLARNRQALGM